MSPTIRISFLAVALSVVSPTIAEGADFKSCHTPGGLDILSLEPSDEFAGGYQVYYYNSERNCSNSDTLGIYADDGFRVQVQIIVNPEGVTTLLDPERIIVTPPPGYMILPEEPQDIQDGSEIYIQVFPALF